MTKLIWTAIVMAGLAQSAAAPGATTAEMVAQAEQDLYNRVIDNVRRMKCELPYQPYQVLFRKWSKDWLNRGLRVSSGYDRSSFWEQALLRQRPSPADCQSLQ